MFLVGDLVAVFRHAKLIEGCTVVVLMKHFKQSVFHCQLAATIWTRLGLVLTFVPTVQADEYLIAPIWGGLVFVAGHILTRLCTFISSPEFCRLSLHRTVSIR